MRLVFGPFPVILMCIKLCRLCILIVFVVSIPGHSMALLYQLLRTDVHMERGISMGMRDLV
jgi:hypothetical protein